MNAITTLKVYRHNDMWVFDDDDRELVKEPFVGGTDTIISVLMDQMNIDDDKVIITFSCGEFPGAQITYEWMHPSGSGNQYWCPQLDMEGWLCPALLKYFDTPPKKIYVQFKKCEE